MSSLRSGSPLQAVSRRHVLQGAAALAATLITAACGVDKAATQTTAARVNPTGSAAAPAAATRAAEAAAGSATTGSATAVAGSAAAPATKPVTPAAAASTTSGTAVAGSPGVTAPAPTLPANATPNALAAAPPPGATPTAGPVIGSAAALPSPGPAELAAFNKDPNMKLLDAVDWETPLAAQQPFLTDTKSFFVRAHYPFPTVKQEEWKLSISGLVDKPVTLTYDQLTKMPSKKLTAWIECAGDGRGRFKPMASGGQWQVGAVSNAEWMGVPLNDVLAMASPKSGIVDIVCSGAGNSQWSRGLSFAKAKDPDTMLVWQMNGEALRVEQGFPVRLIVPGYPGVAQVKWITNIDLIDKPYDGYFNTTLYTFIDASGKNLGQLTTMPVKSIITSLAPNASVKSGMQTVSGKAWSGTGGGITKVEVSADGGKTWNAAKLAQQAGQWSWYAFEYAWDAKDGNTVLTSRATDAKGNVQPEIPPFNKNGYQYNGWWMVPVTVGAQAAASTAAPASTSVATTAANASATGGNTVNVVEKDFAIALDKATVSVGSVTFTIKNDGPSPHNLAFPDLKKVSETIDAGATTKLTVDLKAGTYTYICNVPGHEQRGMKGTLTVK